MERLTAKQEKFINEYLATGNATEAYRRSYNCKNMQPQSINRNAHALVRNDKIASRLNEVTKKSFNKQVLTREWVIERLMLNAQMALGQADIPYSVTADGETKTVIYRKVDHTAANKSLELLGKVDGVGMFVDRSTVDIKNEFAHMDDGELDAYINSRLN